MKKMVLIFFAILVFGIKIHAEKEHLDKSYPLQFIERELKAYQERYQIPGIAVVLYYKDKSYFFSYGFANLSTKKPVNEHTIFEIGSITKSFTALALAAEVLKGRIRLDDSVNQYLPAMSNFKGPISKVTLRDLAMHISGFPRSIPNKNQDNYRDMVRYLSNWAPKKTSETQYQYSNFGFGLLGLALEFATHQSYMYLISTDILEPLKMDRTFLEVPSAFLEDYAQGYRKNGSSAPRWPITLMHAAGGLRSTASDMGKFLGACLEIPGTPPEFIRAIRLTEKGDFKLNKNKTQVLSWIKTEKQSYSIYAKNGGVPGFATFIGFVPEYKIGIVIIANKIFGNTKVGQRILTGIGDQLSLQQGEPRFLNESTSP